MYPPQKERKSPSVVIEMPGQGSHEPDESINERGTDRTPVAAVSQISRFPRTLTSNFAWQSQAQTRNGAFDPDDDCLYVGTSEGFEVVVASTHSDVSQVPLHPRNDLHNYSYSYGWGHADGSALQLALALLASALNSDRRAFLLHEWFAAEVMAHMDPRAGWVVSRSHVRRLVSHYEKSKTLHWNDQDQVYVEEAIP